jgi:sporulation-control protein
VFQTFLASVGVGAARVDLVLDHAWVTMGKNVTGKVVVTGGKTAQMIEGLTVHFKMESYHAKALSRIEEEIATVFVSDEAFEICPGEEREFPFAFACPRALPASSINTKYFFTTDLEIKHGKDSHDRDYIEVRPDGFHQNFLEAVRSFGLKTGWEGLIKQENEWYQLIQLHPTAQFSGKFDELILYFRVDEEGGAIEGVLETDLSTSGQSDVLVDMLNLDETTRRFRLTKENLETPEQAKAAVGELVKTSLHLAG